MADPKKQKRSRLIVVSNRLPITMTKTNGEYSFRMSSGGLVAGLEGVKKKLSFLWIGWTGCEVPLSEQANLTFRLQEEYSCVPVYLDDKLADEHYNGFSNSVLWPLFHYMVSDNSFEGKLWNSYLEANKKFAEVVLKIWKPGDMIWVHDYHLIKLPEFLRKENPTMRIGFFLHIPFPSSEIFQVLAVRKNILYGMLHCDLLGFHTYDYARHFLSACTRILGLETTPDGVYYNGRFVPVAIFPVGIDPEKFSTTLKSPEVIKKIEDYSKNFAGKKVLIGVDRLDYIKGIPHKLRAFKLFFERYPEWRGKVVLIQVAVPSRTDVEEYKKLKNEVDALVGKINGLYGSVEFTPVQYLFTSIPFPELCALYRLSDVMLITSTRDGMNLVAQEYIACQQEKHGVLILSEFAGSATALSGSMLVNPYNTSEVAQAIYEAITMSPEMKERKYKHLYSFITKHTATFWGESFINDLQKACIAADELRQTPRLTFEELEPVFKRDQKRIIIFCTDGVLIPFKTAPFQAKPSGAILNILRRLSKDKNNIIHIISGRDRSTLYRWFGELPISLVAEHGFFTLDKCIGSSNWKALMETDLNWKDNIKPIFEYFTERTPGSYFEEKETSLTWHYRGVIPEFGNFRSQELLSHLANTTFPVDVVTGEKTIEVRPYECNYSVVLKRILHVHTGLDITELAKFNGTIIYCGSPVNLDLTPAPNVYTCSVGRSYYKQQKYYVQDHNDFLQLFEKLSQIQN